MSDQDAPQVRQPRRRRAAPTIEGRENQLVGLAIDEIERRIIDGTASSQLLVHFAKLGSTQHKLEMKELQIKTELQAQRIKDLESRESNEKIAADAIAAMRSYQGRDDEHYEGYYDYTD